MYAMFLTSVQLIYLSKSTFVNRNKSGMERFPGALGFYVVYGGYTVMTSSVGMLLTFTSGFHGGINVLSRVSVTRDGVRIGNWIY
jgi:hypothetical protein